jgi:hypothetical protein
MRVVIFLLYLSLVNQVYAQSSSASSTSSSSSSASLSSANSNSSSSSYVIKDDGDYKVGNKIRFPVEVSGKLLDESLQPSQSVAVPTTSILRILDVDKDRMIVKVSKGSFLRYLKITHPQEIKENWATDRGLKSHGSGEQNLKDKAIQIDAKAVVLLSPSRNGWTYGGLAVPYKYHPKGSKSFTGAATLAPYMGYRFDRYGSAYGLKIIGFAGISNINVTQNVDGEEVTQSLSAFSYGGGVLGEINKSVQAGLVIGKDRVNDNVDYVDNGETWISIAIAFPFSN